MPKISALPAAGSVAGADLGVSVQGGTTKQITYSLVLAYVQANIQITESQVTNLTTDLAAKLAIAQNLADLNNAATARTNLGLGSAAVVSVPISLTNGGTNAALTASNGGIFYSSATAASILSGTATANQLLLSGASTTPAWSSTTYPSTNAINTMMYASSANVLGVVTPVNSALLISSAGGVPSWSNSAIPAHTMAGNINMGGFKATNAAEPSANSDYATKNYVDQTALNGTSVYAASAASLGTVTQSGAGVGATLTNAGTQATFALDGASPPAGVNVLIKNTATGMAAANEGIYTVTSVGSGATNWVLTRATGYDTPTEINNTGLIVVQNGTTLGGTAWYNATTIVTVDTTAFSFTEFGNIVFPITLGNGGTNANLTASNGGIFYSSSTAGAILSGTATAGLALLSGASTTPAWSTLPPITKVATQIISATGSSTYTPTTGMKFAIVEICGAGGGSGGAAGAAGQTGCGGGGAGGGYCRKTYTSTLLGATATVVIGTGGTAGASGNNAGGAGGNSTFTPAGAGAILTATGGSAGGGSASSATFASTAGGTTEGTGTNGDLNLTGSEGTAGVVVNGVSGVTIGGTGGNSFLSNPTVNGTFNGSNVGNNYGGGGSGGVSGGGANVTGAAGANGVCYITEFIAV